MNFMFEGQEQYLTSEQSERVRYCSCHENTKFLSSSQCVMFFLLYGDYYMEILLCFKVVKFYKYGWAL